MAIERAEELEAETRRILDAAWDVLRRTGYENLKLQAVIRIAGVSVSTFYRHFDSKQDLMAALLREELRRATSVLRSATADGTPSERVRAWVDAIVSLAFGQSAGPRARWFTTMPSEVRELLDADGQHLDESTVEPLRQAIADGAASGELRSPDPARDAMLVHSLCTRLVEGGPPTWLSKDRREAVDLVAGFVLAALTAPRPAP